MKRGILIAGGLMLFLVTAGIFCVFAAFFAEGPGSVDVRRGLLVMAAICLALPVWMAFVFLRRKLKTGQFSPTPEEVAAIRARAVTQQNSPRYRRNIRALYGVLALLWIGTSAVWIRAAVYRPDKRLWAVCWVAISIINLFSLVRMTRKPPFGIGPGSGASANS